MDLSQINWLNLSVEVLAGALLEGLILLLVAGWLVWRARAALREGRFDDMVIFSFNLIKTNEAGEPVLHFRTPLSGSLDEIFVSPPLIKEIKAAARAATNESPIIRLRDPKLHSALRRQLVNYSNRLNTAGQMAALTGQPYREVEYSLALVYEPGAKTKTFRVVPVSAALLEELRAAGEGLRFVHAYHADRLTVLRAIEQELALDARREAEARTLASFMASSPAWGARAGA
jgi:hypothetical protein